MGKRNSPLDILISTLLLMPLQTALQYIIQPKPGFEPRPPSQAGREGVLSIELLRRYKHGPVKLSVGGLLHYLQVLLH